METQKQGRKNSLNNFRVESQLLDSFNVAKVWKDSVETLPPDTSERFWETLLANGASKEEVIPLGKGKRQRKKILPVNVDLTIDLELSSESSQEENSSESEKDEDWLGNEQEGDEDEEEGGEEVEEEKLSQEKKKNGLIPSEHLLPKATQVQRSFKFEQMKPESQSWFERQQPMAYPKNYQPPGSALQRSRQFFEQNQQFLQQNQQFLQQNHQMVKLLSKFTHRLPPGKDDDPPQ